MTALYNLTRQTFNYFDYTVLIIHIYPEVLLKKFVTFIIELFLLVRNRGIMNESEGGMSMASTIATIAFASLVYGQLFFGYEAR